MGKKNEGAQTDGATTTAAPAASNAIVLPNGQKRVDYIRQQFAAGVKRGDIRKAINDMYEAAGQPEKKIPYQIVFAATKQKKEASAPASA